MLGRIGKGDCMSSKESIILLLKELEQEINALEEEIVKKTETEVNETIADFTYTIKKQSRQINSDIIGIQTKMNDMISDYKEELPISAYRLVHLT